MNINVDIMRKNFSTFISDKCTKFFLIISTLMVIESTFKNWKIFLSLVIYFLKLIDKNVFKLILENK